MADRKSLVTTTAPTTPITSSATGDKPQWPDGRTSPGTPASTTSGKPRWPKVETQVSTKSEKKSKPWWKKVTSALSHVMIFIFLAVYTAAGGITFRHLEVPKEKELDIEARIKYNETWDDVYKTLVTVGEGFKTSDEIRGLVHDTLLMFQEAVIDATEAGVDLGSSETESQWTFPSSFFFAATVVTTIGYGNIAPITFWGRLFCIIYALLGIPLTLIAIGDMGKLFASTLTIFKKFFQKYVCRCRRRKLSTDSEHDSPKSTKYAALWTFLQVMGAIALLLIYIALGALMFTQWESWTYFESFYFCFITMTTIGLGDITPHHQMYMLLCTFYILIGLAVTSTCIELARSEYEKSWQRMLEASRRLHGISLADTLRKLNDQIETHGEIVDFSIMKDIRRAIRGMGDASEGDANGEPRLVVYESNI
uniref:Potassium channel domain-containing protein n=1 Tax=Strigamia maritima TaxID=126957 RepID=T1IV41_STRMM